MKRIILLLAIALIATSCSFTSKPLDTERQGDWDKENPLYGDVDSVIIISYDLYQQFGVSVPRRVEDLDIFRFNEAGDVVESLHYMWLSNRHTSFSSREVFRYDSEGDMVERLRYGKTEMEQDFDPMNKWRFKHDKQTNTTNVISLDYDLNDSSKYEKSKYKIISQYDQNGDETEAAHYYLDGSLWFKYTYVYNDQGDITEKAHYNSDGSLEHKYTYIYDEQGNEIEHTFTSDIHIDTTKRSYTYDSRGNIVEEIKYDTYFYNSSYRTYKYKYDSHGNRIEKITYVKDNPYPVTHTEYRIYYRK